MDARQHLADIPGLPFQGKADMAKSASYPPVARKASPNRFVAPPAGHYCFSISTVIVTSIADSS